MSLDPQREALVRKMVPDKSTWPSPFLRMKQLVNGTFLDFGQIEDVAADGSIVITDLESGLDEALYFDNLDQLVAAGWAVD